MVSRSAAMECSSRPQATTTESVHIDANANGNANGNGVLLNNKTKPVKGCWATLLTKPDYLQGLLVLHASMRAVQSAYPFNIMATPQLSAESREIVRAAGIGIIEVESLRPKNGRSAMPGFERFGDTWTKLRAFELDGYDRVVLLDCDMIMFQNMDELFDLELPGERGKEAIAACHACCCNPLGISHYPDDWVPANCAYTPLGPNDTHNPTQAGSSPRTYNLLNGGLLVLNPSREAMDDIIRFLETSPLIGTFKFPDQDLLSAVYEGRWKSLPYIYNALKTLRKVHQPLWRDADVKNIHFILDKPWDGLPGTIWPTTGKDYTETHGWWWSRYLPILDTLKMETGSNWELVDKYVI